MFLDELVVRKLLTQKFNHNNFNIKQFDLKSLECDGIIGEHFQLICTITELNSTKLEEHYFFVKKLATNRNRFENDNLNRVFKKEVATLNMFKNINLPTLTTSYPHCFYLNDKCIIFEDLTRRGYQIQTSDRVATDEEVHVVLKTLAGMHAASIAFEEQETIKRKSNQPIRLNEIFPEAFQEIYMILDQEKPARFHYALFKGLNIAIEVYNLPKVLKTGKGLEDELKRFPHEIFGLKNGVEPSKKYRNVMSHADLWPGNIFIRYNENGAPLDAKIVDYQTERYVPPAFDVLEYILLNTNRDYRKKDIMKLKWNYYNFFCNYLEEYGVDPLKIYTFKEFLDSFKEVELCVIYLALHSIPLIFNPDQSLKDWKNSAQFKSIFIDDRTPLFSKISDNVYYANRVRDCLWDMVEYFENN